MDALSRGPAQRRYAATVNSARRTGDLEALDALQNAMAQARRYAVRLHGCITRESVAAAAVDLFELWRRRTQ